MALCQLCQCHLHMVICVINFWAFSSASTRLFFVYVHVCVHPPPPCPRPPRPLLRVYKSLRACVHVTMINESGKAPVGRDQVQQDLT